MKKEIPFEPGSKIFAYLRDSGGAEQELSIDQQKNALEKWAFENDLIISKYFVDEAKRGSSAIGREQLQTMMREFRHDVEERGVVV